MTRSRFVQRAVERFDLGDGDWVDLLARLSYGDRGAIEEKLLADAIRITDEPKGSTEAVHAKLHAGNLELLKRTVVAWGGPGFCVRGEHPHDGECAPAAITEETLDKLDETGERILEELQRRMVKPAKDFSGTPSQPSPTEAPADLIVAA
jgi:hypothetical protein